MYGYNNKNIAPCYQCLDRVENCHSTCEKYNKWRNNFRDKKRYVAQQINPIGCRYFKERLRNNSALQSKKRYR